MNASEYTAISSVFIFDAAELAATIANNRLDEGDFESNTASIARWLSFRDRELDCITKVPNAWGGMPYVIQDAIDNGVGEAFCPTCQQCYPASQLVKPLSTFNAGWNFNSINCPENHLLHQTQGMHIHKG